MTAGKTITLTRRTFVGKIMSLLFSMLSRLVIKLEPIIQSEESRKDKHQYSILMHIYGI